MERKETRGAKKGRKITWNTRPVETKKNISVSYRATEEERDEIRTLLKETEGDSTSQKIIKGLKLLKATQKI